MHVSEKGIRAKILSQNHVFRYIKSSQKHESKLESKKNGTFNQEKNLKPLQERVVIIQIIEYYAK